MSGMSKARIHGVRQVVAGMLLAATAALGACEESSDESFFDDEDDCRACYCSETTGSDFAYNQCVTRAAPSCDDVRDEASECAFICACS